MTQANDKGYTTAIRAALDTGEWFQPMALADQVGCGNANVYLVMKKYRQAGRAFEKRPHPTIKGAVEQRLLPEGTPTTKALVPTKSKAARKQATHATEAPALGTLLGVNLLAMDDDGEVTIGLRNGKRTYLVKLVGVR